MRRSVRCAVTRATGEASAPAPADEFGRFGAVAGRLERSETCREHGKDTTERASLERGAPAH